MESPFDEQPATPNPTPSAQAPVYPGSLRPLHRPASRDDLRQISLVDLSTEMLARLSSGEVYRGDAELLLAEQLERAIASRLDVHENRFAPSRYGDLLQPILTRVRSADLKGRTVVDLGCGSLNPFAFSFLLLMLGAERAYAIDMAPIQDLTIAVRALAGAAGWFLLDSSRVLGPDSMSPHAVLENLRGFSLPLLSAGDAAGIAPDRLRHCIESIDSLSLADAEADAVFSVSLFEHIDRVDDALESLRRITRPGGVGVHVIDFADHRIYSGEVASPFEFLKVDSSEPLVEWSNRIRCDQFCALFERHGFLVEHVEGWEPAVPLTDVEHAQFVEPYRSMHRDNVKWLGARIFVRRD